MSERPKTCASCAFSRWQLTPTGRIKNKAGRCVAVFSEPALPACIVRPHYQRSAVWMCDGVNCPLYEAATEKPKPVSADEMAKLNGFRT